MTRPLPHSTEAERAILGSILLEPAVIAEIREQLSTEDLHDPAHRVVYRRMLDMHGRGRPVDLVSLWEELAKTGELERAGGEERLAKLSDGVPAGDPAFVRNWLRIVRERSGARKLINLTENMQARAYDGEAADEIVSSFRSDLDAIHSNGTGNSWREAYQTVGQMLSHGPVKLVIENFLLEGHATFLGGAVGHYKTWLALSMVKALTTGRNFLGLDRYRVREVVPVLYLVPEINSQMMGARAAKLGIPDDERVCLFRTLSMGAPLPLDHPDIVNAVRAMHPVVFFDPVVRMTRAEDFNSAAQNQEFVRNTNALLHLDARAVVAEHHSNKAWASNEEMTVENVLADTRDFGAMCRVAYGIRLQDGTTGDLLVKCVKPGDFDSGPPLYLRAGPLASSYFDSHGDFAILTESTRAEADRAKLESLVRAIEADPGATYKELSEQTGISTGLIERMAAKAGYQKKGKKWARKPQKTA
jgi:hypothetical protein